MAIYNIHHGQWNYREQLNDISSLAGLFTALAYAHYETIHYSPYYDPFVWPGDAPDMFMVRCKEG